MKNTFWILLFFGLFGASGVHAQQQKYSVVAYVDADAIVKQMPEYKEAKTKLEAYQKQQVGSIDKDTKEIAAYYQEVMKKVEEGTLTPKDQAAAEAKLQEMQELLQQKQLTVNQSLVRKEKEYTKSMYERFEKAIKKVAIDNKYDYIIESRFLLHSANTAIDATDKLKKELGL